MRDSRGGEAPFPVQKAFWGYVIRGSEGPPVLLQVAQGVVLALGCAFTAGALALVAGSEGEGIDGMRAVLATTLSSLALLLVWFATRGGVVELHLDLARGELREMVRHRLGRATVLGRHGLAQGASLRVERPGAPGGPAALLLLLRPDGEALCIARGPECALQELRRRLDHDLRNGLLVAPARGRLAA
jgi:hypothetical protein